MIDRQYPGYPATLKVDGEEYDLGVVESIGYDHFGMERSHSSTTGTVCGVTSPTIEFEMTMTFSGDAAEELVNQLVHVDASERSISLSIESDGEEETDEPHVYVSDGSYDPDKFVTVSADQLADEEKEKMDDLTDALVYHGVSSDDIAGGFESMNGDEGGETEEETDDDIEFSGLSD